MSATKRHSIRAKTQRFQWVQGETSQIWLEIQAGWQEKPYPSDTTFEWGGEGVFRVGLIRYRIVGNVSRGTNRHVEVARAFTIANQPAGNLKCATRYVREGLTQRAICDGRSMKPVAMFARREDAQLWIEKLNGQPVCWSREFGLSKLVVK